MRTKTEFLERIKEYGFLKYEQPHQAIGNAENSDITVYLFLRNDIKTTVIFEECGEDTPNSIIIIGGSYKERKLVQSIAEGTDTDDEA